MLVPARYGVSDGFTFRQSDDFLYLTGLELPDAVLVLDADAQTVVVFSPERDARYASSSRMNDFPGRLLAADPDVSTRSGIATFRFVSELSTAVEAWVTRGKTLRVNLGRRGAIPRVTSDFVANERRRSPRLSFAEHVLECGSKEVMQPSRQKVAVLDFERF